MSTLHREKRQEVPLQKGWQVLCSLFSATHYKALSYFSSIGHPRYSKIMSQAPKYHETESNHDKFLLPILFAF